MRSAAINIINNIMVVYFRGQYKEHGKNKSGMYNYYHELMTECTILRDEDVYLIDYIQSHYAPDEKIHEIACGAAQLGHTLSLFDYNITATELDNKRYKLAKGLGKYLGSNCNVLHENSFTQDTGYDLVVTNNAVSSATTFNDSHQYFKDVLKKGGEIIINPNLFDGSMNKELLLDNFKKVGIGYTELEHDYIILEVLHECIS